MVRHWDQPKDLITRQTMHPWRAYVHNPLFRPPLLMLSIFNELLDANFQHVKYIILYKFCPLLSTI